MTSNEIRRWLEMRKNATPSPNIPNIPNMDTSTFNAEGAKSGKSGDSAREAEKAEYVNAKRQCRKCGHIRKTARGQFKYKCGVDGQDALLSMGCVNGTFQPSARPLPAMESPDSDSWATPICMEP